MVSYILCDVK